MASDKVIRLNFSEFKQLKYEKFSRFVNELLLLRAKVDLHTFQLHCDSDSWQLLNCNDLRTWIGYAVRQNVKVLDVELYQYDRTVLPCCIFSSLSLEDLKLNMGKAPYKDYEHEGLVLPDIIKLPSLKRLTLCDVEVDTFSLKNIIAGSPGLEDLHLTNCAQHLHLIESRVLKRLTVNGLLGRDKGLTIVSPCLIHFECTGWPLNDILWREPPSLESAHIDTGSQLTFDGQSDFMGIFLHAKTLALFGSDIKVMLQKELPTCSAFESLQTLEIGGWCLTDDFNAVLRFLQLSPRLEKLTLKHRKPTKATKETGTDSMPIAATSFQCPLLETVTIHCSKDDDKNEIDRMVNALAANGSSLEKIKVSFYEDIRERELAERRAAGRKETKHRGKLEAMLERSRKWVDDFNDYEEEEEEDEMVEDGEDYDDYF